MVSKSTILNFGKNISSIASYGRWKFNSFLSPAANALFYVYYKVPHLTCGSWTTTWHMVPVSSGFATKIFPA
jgi:hypothetical protein